MIEPPVNCPCCGSLLVWNRDLLYCVNDNCLSSVEKQIQHFTTTLKIKGLGPSSIKKLGLQSIKEIYDLSVDDLTKALSSEKLAIKLYNEIEKSKKANLNQVLPALGIPLIGKSATDKLSLYAESIWDIDKDLCKLAGLGEKSTANLLNYMETKESLIIDLPFDFLFAKRKIVNETKGTVCITGKLNSFSTKAAAKEALEKAGYIVKPSVTKDVTILINESGVSTAKTKKAADSGIIIVENLNELIGVNK